MELPRLPSSSDRLFICGQTGTGKTQAACWHLAKQNIDQQPWIILDYKGDELINAIEKAEEIEYASKLPTKAGIYILRCNQDEGEEVTEILWRIHAQGKIGVWVDESYMLGSTNKAFNTLLTQGRGLRIPMINLTQRPVWCSPWLFSEAQFFRIFDLIKKADRVRISDDIPISPNYELPEFHSYYYDLRKKLLVALKPVPSGDEILAMIDAKLPQKRRIL